MFLAAVTAVADAAAVVAAADVSILVLALCSVAGAPVAVVSAH